MKTNHPLALVGSVFLCTALATGTSLAQPVTLVGTFTCAEYLGMSEKDRYYPKVWTLGYLSGWAFTTRIDALKGFNHERVGEFLLDYCKANIADRKSSIPQAADVLRLILEKRAKGEPVVK